MRSNGAPSNILSTLSGETFRVLKEKELARFGEYRTRRLVLEAWHRLLAPNLELGAQNGGNGED